MSADGVNLAVVHYNNTVGVLYARNTLRDNELGGVGNFLGKRPADFSVGRGINRAGGVVENKDFRLFEQRSGYAQSLLLSARYVSTALLDFGVVFVGEGLNKIVCAGELAGVYALLLGRVFIASAEVVEDCAAEQHVFLQNY